MTLKIKIMKGYGIIGLFCRVIQYEYVAPSFGVSEF
jgi:hypothetical protein